MTKSVAIIGSRGITESQFNYLVKVAEAFARRGWRVRTGCADGADYAAMVGTRNINPDLLDVFLPWASYNQNYQAPTDNTVTYNERLHPEWTASINTHPAPHRLTRGGKALMARNYGILMHEKPVDVVVAFPPNLDKVGGTGQGIRLAQEHNIPLYIVCEKSHRVALKQFVESMPII